MSYSPPASAATKRHVYMVLSPRSLGYARLALETLLANSDEPLDLRLITDSAADKQALTDVLAELPPDPRHTSSVHSEAELADIAATRFARFPHLRAFRDGHPCWRKITDPALLSAVNEDGSGEEMVLLDPDLYFPNRFRFEPTPASGLLLMWQQPNCLLPPEVVRAAIDAGIPLARHVDIGVSHWRLDANDGELAWTDALLGTLKARLGAGHGTGLPRMMHVEAIVWAAIAMHTAGTAGSGYLDPREWVCWRRSQGKRVLGKLGFGGGRLLDAEPWPRMKCFHAGGEAKWWLADHKSAAAPSSLLTPGRIAPFVPLTPARYGREQAAKGLARSLGYYRLFDPKQP